MIDASGNRIAEVPSTTHVALQLKVAASCHDCTAVWWSCIGGELGCRASAPSVAFLFLSCIPSLKCSIIVHVSTRVKGPLPL